MLWWRESENETERKREKESEDDNSGINHLVNEHPSPLLCWTTDVFYLSVYGYVRVLNICVISYHSVSHSEQRFISLSEMMDSTFSGRYALSSS